MTGDKPCKPECEGCCDCDEFPRYHHRHECQVPSLDELDRSASVEEDRACLAYRERFMCEDES